MDKTIRLLCDAHELKHIESIGKELMPVADALQPIYHLLDRASMEWHEAYTSLSRRQASSLKGVGTKGLRPSQLGSKSVTSTKHISSIERGPHYASVPAPIRTWIEKYPKPECITIEFVLITSGRAVHVHIHSLDSAHDLDEVARLIWIWLQTLDAILAKSDGRTAGCSRDLHIYLYLTPFLKQWPKTNQPKALASTEPKANQPKASTEPKAEPKAESIEEIHVNSGFAFPCSESASGSNSIYVFREEEWFKVLIHETIHAFGVDFSAMSSNDMAIDKAIRALDTAFPGVAAAHHRDKNCICLFEAYTECWAEWIAILFRVHEYGKHSIRDIRIRNHKHTWKSDFVRHLELERRWSMLQASRMQTWFASNPDRMYRNRTPVFAYYVLKSVLMCHSVAFMAWCNKSNGKNIVFDMDRVESFGQFLRDHAHAVDASSMQLASSMNIQSIAGSSLRMSLWGD